MIYIIGVTSCATGIAQTYMAAEAIEQAARKIGAEVKIETIGALATEQTLTKEDINRADLVIVASDHPLDLQRFQGKTILEVELKDAIKDAKELLQQELKRKK